ncbi:MAG: HpcH/HpaI aldolase/citrate lyase family protein [Rubrobacteraceae bacterium]|nr:CoA ester lyase [Rubrobacter sp.]
MKAPRSILAVPANNLRMVEKALASEADTVFLDLEDAVAPDNKADARKEIVRALQEFDWRGRPTTFRINALDTPWWYQDMIEVTEEAGGSLDTLIIPKVRRPADLHAADVLLAGLEMAGGLEPGKVRIEAQIENAEGLVNADGITGATGRLTALHFGPGDFAASLRMPLRSIGTMDEWDAAYPGHRFHYAMQRIVAAARAAGLRALDGPVANYGDEEGLRESCKIARSLGFDGKWCIHPAQIRIVNEIFSPSDEEIEWARKVVDAYEEANAAGSGAISVDGQMVDAASIRMARNTLDVAGESGG